MSPTKIALNFALALVLAIGLSACGPKVGVAKEHPATGTTASTMSAPEAAPATQVATATPAAQITASADSDSAFGRLVGVETFHPNAFTVVTVSTYRDRGRDIVIAVTQTFDNAGNPLPASTTRSETTTRFWNGVKSGGPMLMQGMMLALIM